MELGVMEDSVLFGQKTTSIHFGVENARDLIGRGLIYFFGDKAVWLPEYEIISEWLSDNKGKGLLCIGDAGRGKSFVCERILLPIIEKKLPYARISKINAYTMSDDYKNSLGGIVFVDDIGVERESNVYGEKLVVFNQIVNDVERFGWTLIVTTNLTIEEIKDKYGHRTFDRLRALTKPVVFSGDSLRNR